MSMATKSISSYLPIRARTNRTRSSIALSTPNRWRACATTTTSPNQEGMLGAFVGSTWIWMVGSVIFLSSFRTRFLFRKTHFCRLCQVLQAFSPSWSPVSHLIAYPVGLIASEPLPRKAHLLAEFREHALLLEVRDHQHN